MLGGIGRAVTVVATAVIVPVAMLFVGVWLLGWRMNYVLTNSMEPTFPVDSLLVTSPIQPADVEVGMPIEFVSPNNNDIHITHRVLRVKRDPEGRLSFITMGDNNGNKDPWVVEPRHIRGEVRWHVAFLGKALWAIRWPRSLAFVVVPGLLLLVSTIRDRFRHSPAPALAAASSSGGPAIPCADCESPIDPTHRYCHSCGTRQPLKAAPAAPDAAESLGDDSAAHPAHPDELDAARPDLGPPLPTGRRFGRSAEPRPAGEPQPTPDRLAQ